ncbi:unnamed protein product [Adineta ricciae]|uniref:TIR domain-containing protein n=1 Tax=Adineta ricciae TaxID=249248 RepID=A0A815VIY5_ADIRI|nr:unnamed protein product [Adineta ricciae]CAF1531059.1 unnamed protein product [Adineta ricciae]
MAQKHVMLSYEWTVQKLVSKVYDYLQQKGIPLWMDIKSGVSSDDLFKCIAEAIENTTCFVCFMTPEYQNSDFCKQEFLYAHKRKVPIVLLKLVENWEPTSWLGFATVGLVWLDFYHIDNLSKKTSRLYKRICQITGNQVQSSSSHYVELIQKTPSSHSLQVYDSNSPYKQPVMVKINNNFRHSAQNLNRSDKHMMKHDESQIQRPLVERFEHFHLSDRPTITRDTSIKQNRPSTTKPSMRICSHTNNEDSDKDRDACKKEIMTTTNTTIPLEAEPALSGEQAAGTPNPGAKVKGAGAVLAKVGSSPVFLAISIILLSIIPIIQIYIGWTYAEACPINYKIPRYLFIAGLVGIISSILSQIRNYLSGKSPAESSGELSTRKAGITAATATNSPLAKLITLITCCLNIFLLVWFVLGCIWVFSAWNQVQYTHPRTTTFCKPLVYRFAAVSLFIPIILLSLCCFCPLCIASTALMDMAAQNA